MLRKSWLGQKNGFLIKIKNQITKIFYLINSKNLTGQLYATTALGF